MNPDNFNEEDAIIANPTDINNEGEDTPGKTDPEAEPVIDYKQKFSESSKEALRLLEENKAKDAELERLRGLGEQPSESLYPGFEDLDEDQKESMLRFTNSLKSNIKEDLYKDPAIAFQRKMYNENKFDTALSSLVDKYPGLKESKDDFKTKYFKADNVPDNIEQILGDVAKIYLFDKAKELGATEERERSNRLDTERARGGERLPQTARTLEEWNRMAQENPAKFAKLSKEYKSDLESGKLTE